MNGFAATQCLLWLAILAAPTLPSVSGQCTTPLTVSNGVFYFTSNVVGATARVYCSPNFALFGNPTSTCQTSGVWSTVTTPCLPRCLTPPTILNGVLAYRSNKPTSNGDVLCNENYVLSPSSTKVSTCDRNGAWSVVAATCEAQCPTQPATISNGLLNYTSNRLGSKATLVCSSGYTLFGSSLSTCLNGKWTTPGGSCQPSACNGTGNNGTCTASQSVRNGLLQIKNNFLSSVANVVCNANYTLVGNGVSTCQVTGMWSVPSGTCQARCVNPPSILNGAFAYTSDNPGSNATVVCNDNYALSPFSNSASTCASDTWSPVTASCEENCPINQTVTNGFLRITTNIQRSTALIVCNANYVLIGNGGSTCQSNGTWSSPSGICEKNCPTNQVITNGLLRINTNTQRSTALMVCNANYVLVGSGSSSCQSNGTWSTPSGKCEKLCIAVPTLANGFLRITTNTPGSTASLICDNGYLLVGGPMSTCTAGNWIPPSGSCQSNNIICPAIKTVPNGLLQITTNSLSSVAKVVCFANYSLVGNGNSSCQATGMWSDPVGSCQARCVNPPTVMNGAFAYSTDTSGSTARILCDNNYALSTETNTSMCTNGSWINPTVTCLATLPPSRSTESSTTITAGITASKSWISNPDTIALLAVLACLGITLILVVVVVVVLRRKSAPGKDSHGGVLENSASVQPRTFGPKNMTHNKNYEETYAQPGAAAFGYSDPTGAMQRSSKRITLPPNVPLAGDPRHSTLAPGDPTDVTAYAQAGPQITKKEDAADTDYHALSFGNRNQQTARPPSTVDDAPGQDYNSLQRLKVTSSDSARLSGSNVSPRNSALMANTDGAAQQPTANASVDYAVPEKKPKPADVSTNSLATMPDASEQTTTSGPRESTYETIPGETQKTLTIRPAGNTPGGNAGTSPKLPAAHSTLPVSATVGGVLYAIADKTGKSGKTHGSSSAAGPVEAGCGEVTAELLPGKAVYAVLAKAGKQAPTARANETQQIGEEGSTTMAVVRDSTYETISGELADAVSGKSEQNVTSSSSSAAALIVSDPEGVGSEGSPKGTGARVSAYETVPGEDAYAIPATTNKRATAPPPPGHGYAPVGPPAVAAASRQAKSGTASAPTYATPHKDKQAETSSPSTIASDAPTASDPECRGSGGPQKSATATASMYETIPGEATYATVDTANKKATSSPPRAGGYAEIGPASVRSANRASFQPELQDGEDFPAAPMDEEVQEAETTLTASGCALNQPSANDPLLDHVVYDNGPASNTVQV